MRTVIRYAIWPRDLDFGEVFGRIESFASKRNMKNRTGLPVGPPYEITIDVDPSETIATHSLEEFRESGEHLAVDVSYGGRFLEVSVDCRDADIVTLLQEQLRSDFGLQKAPVPPPDKQRATYPQPTVFLGRHFDERAAGMAQKLRQFLSLLGLTS
jgi:hypothetical protein